jgi:hypothetical protein
LDPAGPAGVLVNDLIDAGLTVGADPDDPNVDVVLLDGPRSQRACADLVDAVVERQFVHRDQQALNLAVVGARRRQSGDAWKWSRRDSEVDISPLVAATIAYYLWRTAGEASDPWFAFG